jgi:hypothetical protein
MIPAITALLPFAGKLLDKFVPDPQAKAEAQLRLAEMASNGELAKMANETKLAEMQYADDQSAHKEQQETIRSGDNSSDEYVRRTRPMMARQSWYGAAAYVFAFEGAKLFDKGTGADWEIAMMLLSVALAYHGFRSFDKSKWGRK